MPASRRTKWIIGVVVAVVAIVAAQFAYGFFVAWQRFAAEERICGAFHPVFFALDKFHGDTGSLPTNLVQLLPKYLEQIPTVPVADSIDYRILPDGTNWQISVQSRITGTPRIFLQRSTQKFTAEEQRQSVTGFHGWLVFRP